MLQCCELLPSVVCLWLCIVAKQCVLPKNCLTKQIGSGLLGTKWSRDRERHVTLKCQGCDYTLRAEYIENSCRCYLALKQLLIIYSNVCCEAERSAILATAWLLVNVWSDYYCRPCCIIGQIKCNLTWFDLTSALTIWCPMLPWVRLQSILVKPSFVIFDTRAPLTLWHLWRSALSVRVPGCQKLQMTA